MKTLLFLVLLPFTLLGQADYQTILPDALALYKPQQAFSVYDYYDTAKYFRGVKVIDTVYGTGYTKYKFFYEYHDDNYTTNFNTYRPDCFKMNAQCWLGPEVIIYDNGLNVYFNRNNDSIFINTTAGLNDSWIFYKPDTGAVYTAVVTDTAEIEFLGITDHIKTVTITGNGQSYSLELSQKHGFLKTINFREFPGFGENTYQVCEHLLVGLSNPVLGIQFLSSNDYFNFDIGDEFHFSFYIWTGGAGDYSGYKTKKILSKQINGQYGLEYTYERYEWGNINSPEGGYVFYHDTITQNYHDYFENDSIMPFENYSGEEFPQRYLLSNDRYNGRLLKTFGSSLLRKQDSCYILDFESSGENRWIQGVDYSFRSYDGEGGWSETLVYFKKGDETWGVKLNPPISVEEFDAPDAIKVYPNPATDFLNITCKSPADIDNVVAFDVNGIKTRLNPVNTSQNNLLLDIRNLKKGLYVIQVNFKNSQSERMKIMKE